MQRPRFQLSMRRLFVLLLGSAAVLTALALGEPKVYPDRWVYVSTELDSDQELSRVEGIARTAAEHGLNGMLL